MSIVDIIEIVCNDIYDDIHEEAVNSLSYDDYAR